MGKSKLPTDSIATVSKIDSDTKDCIMFVAHCSCSESHNHYISVEKWPGDPPLTSVFIYQDISVEYYGDVSFFKGMLENVLFRLRTAFKMLWTGRVEASGDFVFGTESQALEYVNAIKNAMKRPKRSTNG